MEHLVRSTGKGVKEISEKGEEAFPRVDMKSEDPPTPPPLLLLKSGQI